MTSRTVLTDELVGTFPTCAPSKRLQFPDSLLPGLILEISSRHKRFIVRFRGNYKSLGNWPSMSVKEARQAAFDFIRSQDKAPTNPFGPRYEPPLPAPTIAPPVPVTALGMALQEVFEEYISIRALKARTKEHYRQCLDKYWSDYLDKPIEAITGDAFLERFRSISAPSGANHSLRLIRALFRFYNAAHDSALPIPTAKTLALEGARELRPKSRLILDGQQRAWFLAVQKKAGPTCRLLFTMLALTGLRIGEALRLTWADIDQGSGLITIHDTKNGKPHVLPLGRHLWAALEAQRGAPGEPVFNINERNTRKMTYKVIDECGVPWSAHDLRRGFVSLAVRLSIPDRLVKRLVNHSESDVTGRHYIHISPDALRPHMQAIEDAMRGMWEGKTTSIEGPVTGGNSTGPP